MLDKKEILFISPNSVRGFSVRNDEVKELVGLPWVPETLGRVLGTVRAAMGKGVRILIGEAFTYSATFPLSKGEFSSSDEEREAVRRIFAECVPEDLTGTDWDYREVPIPGINDSVRYVQAVAIVAPFARALSPARKEAGFKVTASLSESSALAGMFSDRKDPIIFVSKSDGIFIAGAIGGTVLSSVSSFNRLAFESVQSVRNFLEHRFSLSFRTLLFSGDFPEDDFRDFDRAAAEQSGLSIEFSKANAILGLARKNDVSGDDRSALSFTLSISGVESPLEESEPVPEADRSERFHLHTIDDPEQVAASKSGWIDSFRRIPRRTRVLSVMFLVVCLSGVSAVIWLRDRSGDTKEALRTPTVETSAPSASGVDTVSVNENKTVESPEEPPKTNGNVPEESPVFNRASFRVAIENGSGIAGAATRLRETLSDESFVVISAGNAQAIVSGSKFRAKASVPKEFLEELSHISGVFLGENSAFDIPDDSEVDVILILGREGDTP